MRVSIGKSLKINMGNYEHVEVSAHVTLEDTDFPEEEIDPLDIDQRASLLRETAQRYMNDYLEPELKTAAVVSQAPVSMLIDPAPAPRRTERTPRRRSTT